MRYVFKVASAVHAFLYRVSGGRLLGRIAGLDVLLLTTTGRRTGKARTTPLTYIRDGEQIALIASNGGSDRHPDWWLNLRGREGKIQIGREKLNVVAEQASSEVKARLWPRFTEKYPGYDAYQRKTRRDIPVIILHPSK